MRVQARHRVKLSVFAGWGLQFQRGQGPEPDAVQLPATLGSTWKYRDIRGATAIRTGVVLEITPGSRSWEVVWRA